MPEKSLNDIPRAWRELYEKGMAARQRNNFDYAVALFMQVLQKEPGFYECREALRVTQVQKAGAAGGFFKRMLSSASNSPLMAKGQLLLRNSPLEALGVAEQLLNSDPNNVAAHKLLAEAALESDLPRTAVLSLEIAFKNSPKDKELALRLGEALARAGQAARAETIYSDLQRAHPHDQAIAQALKNVSAKRTMSEGGYEGLEGGGGSYRDILKDKTEAVSLEQEQRHVKSEEILDRLIHEAEERRKSEPNNLKMLRHLGELYGQRGNYDGALEMFGQIIAVEGAADPSLEKLIIETKLAQYDQKLSALNPAAADYAEESARLKSEREQYQIAEFQRLVEKYPTDLHLRFEMGKIYFEAGKISEAIQEFQKAQSNPHRRIAALGYLGQCFSRRRMFDLAARALQTAVQEKVLFDAEKKELIYLLGSVYEQMGKKEEAIDHYKKIYEQDIGFRDVAAKVDEYYSQK